MATSSALTSAGVLELADAGSGLDAAERGLLLLEAALPEGSRIGAASLALGARDAHVLALRCGTFGDSLGARVSCPECGMLLAAEIERHELGMHVPEGDDALSRSVQVESGDFSVEARTPDGRTLLAAAAAVDVDAARQSLIRDCVGEARGPGGAIDPLSLPDEVLAAVGEAIVSADRQSEVRVELECAGCAHEWSPVLDIALFFWQELSATSVQILDDVHQLAIGYGWSEPDVLALSARRRRRYVERLLGD
ncbi:MAG: hypothetical protein ACJ768_16840 [Gaiellaceae bacterium]